MWDTSKKVETDSYKKNMVTMPKNVHLLSLTIIL